MVFLTTVLNHVKIVWLSGLLLNLATTTCILGSVKYWLGAHLLKTSRCLGYTSKGYICLQSESFYV